MISGLTAIGFPSAFGLEKSLAVPMNSILLIEPDSYGSGFCHFISQIMLRIGNKLSMKIRGMKIP